MTEKALTLPFIVEGRNNKEKVSYPAEFAIVACLTELQRKRTGFLRDTAEKISFLSKLYYPIWISPIGDSCLAMADLAYSSYNFAFKEPTNIKLFVEDLKRNSVVPQEFEDALHRQAKSVEKIADTVTLSFKALIANKELVKFFSEYLESNSPLGGEKALFVPSATDRSAVAATRETVVNCLRRMQANVRGVQYALGFLKEEVGFHERMTLNDAKLVKEKYEAEVAGLKPEVEKNIEKLRLNRDAVMANISKSAERKIEVLNRKSEKYLQRLQRLEQRREFARKKKSRNYVLERYDREINDARKEIRLLSSMIEAVARERDKGIREFDKDFRVAAATEEAKIKKITSEYEIKIGEKRKYVANMTSTAVAITRSFTSLMDDMKQEALAFREQIAIGWKLDDLTLVCVPIYLAGYLKGREERFSLFSPNTISEEVSVLQELRQMLTLTLEPRLKLLIRPASIELHELLSSAVIKKMQNDDVFRHSVKDLCHANNLLKRDDFEKTLNEGLAEAERRRWITANDAKAISNGLEGKEA